MKASSGKPAVCEMPMSNLRKSHDLLNRFGEYHGAGRFVWRNPKLLFLSSLLPRLGSGCPGLKAVCMMATGQKDR